MDSVHVRTTPQPHRNEKYFDILAADDSYLGPDFDLARYQDVIRAGNQFSLVELSSSVKLQTIVALLLKGIPQGAYAVESYFSGKHGVIDDFLRSFSITEEQFIAETLRESHILQLDISPHVIEQITRACEKIDREYGRPALQE